MALTDTGVRKAKTRDSAYRMSDSGGLYLWVTPAGGKLWRWKYRYAGEEKLPKVYGQAMTSSKRDANSKVVEMVLKPLKASA